MMEYSVYTACSRNKVKRLGRPEHDRPLLSRVLGWLKHGGTQNTEFDDVGKNETKGRDQ